MMCIWTHTHTREQVGTHLRKISQIKSGVNKNTNSSNNRLHTISFKIYPSLYLLVKKENNKNKNKTEGMGKQSKRCPTSPLWEARCPSPRYPDSSALGQDLTTCQRGCLWPHVRAQVAISTDLRQSKAPFTTSRRRESCLNCNQIASETATRARDIFIVHF